MRNPHFLRFLRSLQNVLALASIMAALSACQSPLDPRIEAIVRGPGHVQDLGQTTTRADDLERETEEDAEPIRKRGEKVEKE